LFYNQQYVRYLLPVTPLASLILLASVIPREEPSDIRKSRQRVFSIAMACLFLLTTTLLNLYFSKGAIWYLGTPLWEKVSPSKRLAYEDRLLPEVRANRVMNLLEGTKARVLYDPHRPYGATLAGLPLYATWHNPLLYRALVSSETAGEMGELVSRNRISHVMWDAAGAWGNSPVNDRWQRAVADYLFIHGNPVLQVGTTEVYRTGSSTWPASLLFDISRPQDVTRIAGGDDKPEVAVPLLVDNRSRAFTATVSIAEKRLLKVVATISCAQSGLFLIQILWDDPKAIPHYRPVTCKANDRADIVDIVPVPSSVSRMILYFRTHETSSAPVLLHSYRVYSR